MPAVTLGVETDGGLGGNGIVAIHDNPAQLCAAVPEGHL
jgi:hypothetical protein